MRQLLLATLLLAPLASAQYEPYYMLHMQDRTYLPAELAVPQGATVIAMNFGASREDLPVENHTVTSTADPPLFDVRDIPPTGEAYPFPAPPGPGDYPFRCLYHEEMTGVLSVVAPEPAPSFPTPPEEPRESPAPWLAAIAAGAAAAGLARRRRT